MANPKINLPNEPIDNILDLVGIVGLIAMIGMTFYYAGILPEKIPTHFDFKGEPDAWGSRSSIWTMPILGVALFIVLYFANKFPQQFNFPMKITEDNAAKEYRKATRTLRFINVGIVFLFLFITWRTIQTALGNAEGIGNILLIVVFCSLAGILGYASSKR